MGLGTGATAAIVGGIGAAGSIASGAIGAHAAGQAADAQTQAANHAADLQAQQAQQALAFEKQVYGDQQTNQRPFLQAGQGATYSLANLLGIRMPQQGATTLPSGNILNGSSVDPSGFASLTALRGGNGGNFFNPKSLTSQPEGMFPGGAPPDPNDLGAAGRFGMMSPNAFGAGVPLPTGGTSSFNTAAPITSPPGMGGNQFQMRPPITSPGTATGTQGQINPPITSPGAGGPYQIQMRPPIMSGGAAGMLNPDGSTGADFTPTPNGTPLSYNPQSVTNATTNQGGTGQVPQAGDPQMLGDGGIEQQLQQQGGLGNLTSGPGSADDNSFGSLLKGYGQQFVAPTDVTEQNDPGYKFRLQQGNDAIQRSAAARGGLLSGGTAKSLSDYAQGSASQEYGNVYNRALSTFDNNYNQYNNDQTNKFNRLASLAGFGQTAAGQLSNAGSNAANNVSSTLLTSGQQIGNDIQNAGAARASGYVGGANAINGAISGGTNSLDSILLSQFL